MRFHLFCLALALLLGASTSYAQADLEATVPFDFHAGKRIMPAGEYLFDVDNAGLIWITADQTGLRSVVGSTGVGGGPFPPDAKLIFHRYGDTYYLAEVWREDSSGGRRISQTPGEQELARSMVSRTVLLRASR